MQNLQGTQADRDLYLDQDMLTPEGSRQYANLYMSGTAPDEEGKPKGIPAEDFNNFATEIFILKDHQQELEAKRRAGETITQVDSGTGPSIYNIMAGLGYMDQAISVELAPSNIKTLNDYKTPGKPLPEYWNAWLDLGVIIDDMGSPEKLLALDKEVKITGLNIAQEPNLYADIKGQINLYDSMRKWPLLSEKTKTVIRNKIYEESHITPNLKNPYKAIQEEGLQNVLARKLQVRQGDLFNPLGDDKVPSVADLAGTAHFNTAVFVTESNTRELPKVLHAEANKVQFSKPDGIWVSSHMAGTEGYGGFITAEQLAENPDLEHEECPLSRGLLTNMMGEIVKQNPRYLSLTAGAVPEHRQMVRPGKQYSEAVIISGKVNHLSERGTPKFENGTEFMNKVRDSVLKARHVMNYIAPGESGQAVQDFRAKAESFAQKLGPLGNDSVGWDTLGNKFWNSYSEKNFDQPMVGDVEGLFSVIQSMRDRKGNAFLDIGTGSAPQYALAAVLSGMDKIIVSDHAKGAISWLKQELLDDNPLTPRTQMWVDIAKLLSTFRDRNELVAYCADTGFDRRLRIWNDLSDKEKQEWFDDRRYAVAENGITSHFLDDNSDIKATIKDMSKNGKFDIRQFSIFSPPKDLLSKMDIVCSMYVSEDITEKASENCEALLNSCRLARPGFGIVNLGHDVSSSWKTYEGTNIDLPALCRPYSYLATAAFMVLDDNCTTNYKVNFHKEKHAIRTAKASAMAMPDTVSIPVDRKFDYLTQISGCPKQVPYQNGEEMLAALHIQLLETAKALLLKDPSRRNISSDSHLKSLSDIEHALGMDSPQASGNIPHRSPGVKRQLMAERIDRVIEHMKSPKNVRSVDAMNKQDDLFNDFLHGLHKELVGRGGSMQMAH